jgi:hypothetical protein
MSGDARTDFFASGAASESPPAAPQDARTAFFASGGQSASDASSGSSTTPVDYDAAEFKRRVGREPQPTELANFKQFRGQGWANGNSGGSLTGMGQAALAVGAGTLGGISSAANDILPDWGGSKAAVAAQIAQDPILNYRGGPEAQQYLKGISTALSPVSWAADKAHQGIAAVAGDRAADVTADAAALLPAARGLNVAGIGRKILGSMADPEGIPVSASESPQSMGAARAAPQIQQASPELQQAIREAAQKTGGAVAPEVLNRHLEADSLPVKIQLTEGQATQDPGVLSNEINSRGKIPAIAQRYNEQNQQLVQNVQALRDQVGPDVFSANPVEHGDTLIEAYQAKDKVARDAIDQAFDTARQALPANTPVLDAKQLLDNVNSQLENKWATESAPPDIMKRLSTIADGNGVITAGQFEGLRTRLADLSRSSDGSTRYASHLIRGAVEDADLLPGTEAFKTPFDDARALARTRFQGLEADPAYNAAVNETVSPDQFVRKYVINGTRDNVATMRDNLSSNPTATQTLGVTALDHLRQSAGIDPMGNGNFSQAGFNKHLQALSPKLTSLVDPKTAETLETLGNVARYTQSQPRGSFVNNSNTFTAQAASHAANALEGMANVKAGGIPVGTMVRKALGNRSEAKAAAEALKPGAGLTRLPTPGPPQQ